MAEVYASLIIKGVKTIDDVPKQIRDSVKQALIDKGYSELTGGGNAT